MTPVSVHRVINKNWSVSPYRNNVPADSPTAWELKSDQLIFQEIEGRHTGKNMSDILSHALDKYGLRGKV